MVRSSVYRHQEVYRGEKSKATICRVVDSLILANISGKQFYKVHKMEPSLMEAGQVVANTDWECSVMVS